MQKFLPLRVAVQGTLLILSATILFHFCVMAGLVPPDIVWGGNATDGGNLYVMEGVSIVLNGVMLMAVLSYAGFLKTPISPKWLRVAIWAMTVLFTLNTIGNLLAKNRLETYIFTPLTFLLALFCLRMAAAFKGQRKPVL